MLKIVLFIYFFLSRQRKKQKTQAVNLHSLSTYSMSRVTAPQEKNNLYYCPLPEVENLLQKVAASELYFSPKQLYP